MFFPVKVLCTSVVSKAVVTYNGAKLRYLEEFFNAVPVRLRPFWRTVAPFHYVAGSHGGLRWSLADVYRTGIWCQRVPKACQ